MKESDLKSLNQIRRKLYCRYVRIVIKMSWILEQHDYALYVRLIQENVEFTQRFEDDD